MLHTTAPAPAACVACGRTIPPWDLPRYACAGCQDRADRALRAIPGLYAETATRLVRGAASWPPAAVTGSGAGRSPISEHVADLTDARRGGVAAVLASWMGDWAEVADLALPLWPGHHVGQVRTACRWLRHHLDRACRQHPAVDEALREIREVHGRLTAATGDAPRRLTLACPCGGVVPYRLGAAGYRCDGCGAAYTPQQAAALHPVRQVRAAAAV